MSTPLIDAGIDGTEAIIAVDGPTGDSFVLVQEGIVSVRDRRAVVGQNGQLKIVAASDDEQNAAFATQAQFLTRATPENVPAKFRELLLRPADATDWAIHYPPILFAAGVTNPSVREAAALLDAGETDAAETLLGNTQLVGRDKAAALALRSIAAIVKNRNDQGSALADEAIAADPGLSAGHIAQSYAYQVTGQLASARLSAEAAITADPDDAYAWARLAELHLTVGARRDAREAVAQSLGIAETALGRTIEGFAALSTNDFDAAETAFHRAVEIDSQAPLPRLGLGLKAIRQGDVAKGREEIETAVALDPRRASLRTWLGRAYFEESRGEKAAAQYEIARNEDPDDPNAYFFEAQQLYGENRLIEALRAVEAAQDRGEGRSVVRSQRGLGEDRAVRGAALGRIYENLGLEQLAISEGARAVDADPTNPEAHRFLANVFRAQPNSEITQTSELLKANLLAPPSKTPVQPSLLETDLALLDTVGASRVTFDEYGALFDTNGVRFDASGFNGTQKTFGDELSASLLHDNFSASFGQLFYRTEGYKEDDDLKHDVLGTQLKFRPIEKLTFSGEYRYRKTEAGIRDLGFATSNATTELQQEFSREFYRLGVHFSPNPKTDILAVATKGVGETFDDAREADPVSPLELGFRANGREDSLNVQAQGIYRLNRGTLTVGGSYTDTTFKVGGVTTTSLGGITLGSFPFSSRRKTEQYKAYGYLSFSIWDPLELTIGTSYDVYDDADPGGTGERKKFNPKIGARLSLTDNINLRAAYTRTLNPRVVSNQLLEPTSVMGFSQYFDVSNGAVLETIGAGIDGKVMPDLRAGITAATHRWDNPQIGGAPSTVTKDRVVSGYLQKTFGDRWILSAGVSHEYAEADSVEDLGKFQLTTGSLSIRYIDPNGFFGGVEVEPVFHDFEFRGVRGNEEAFMLNAAIGYRLPNGLGAMSLEAQNLLDQDFTFVDRRFRRNIFSVPRYVPDLTIVAKATFRF